MFSGRLQYLVRATTSIFIMSVSLWLTLIMFASAESITDFDILIEVQADSSLRVTETITYDFEEAERHGIYRDVKETHAQSATSWFKDRYVAFELMSVKRNGQSEPYERVSSEGLSLRIGDPEITLSGPQLYELSYVIRGAVATYETGPEVYWNVTGNEWEVPILNTEITVVAGEKVTLLPDQVCYVGKSGSTEQCESVLVDEHTAVFTATALSAYEGITVAQRVMLPEQPVVLERYDGILIWLIIMVVWFGALLWWLLRWRFFYNPSQSIIVQYEPYQDFKPMFTGVLFDNRLDSRDITAGIVYLAEQGFLSIAQRKEKTLLVIETTDYTLTLRRPLAEVATEFQKKLISLLGFAQTGDAITLSEIKKNHTQLQENAKIIEQLKKAVVDDLVRLGFLQQRMTRGFQIGLIIVLAIIAFIALPISAALFGAHAFGPVALLIGSSILITLFGLERRTTKGYEAMNYLKGFKDFLSTTEKERYTFHNAPAKNPEQFMEYLPYAIAFGVEKEWAEVFKDIQLTAPSWYSAPQGSTFNAVVFTSNIDSFATAFASSTGPTYSSSGSGGGGSSGGGGGGGGGGSW